MPEKEKDKDEAEAGTTPKAAPARTADGKLIIWNVETGQRMERWPVDAQPMLTSGECTSEEPANAVNTPEPPAAPTPPAADGDELTGLPRTTPLGERAVHSTRAETGEARTSATESKRVEPKRK